MYAARKLALTRYRKGPWGSEKIALRLGRVLAQEGGIGVARLNDSPPSEARIIAECADCARLRCEGVHSSIASSTAADFTTSWPVSTSSFSRAWETESLEFRA
jgi:hypothetical protein